MIPTKLIWLLQLLSKRSCQNAKGNPKVRYPSKAHAQKAADHLSNLNNRQFDVYRCWFHCRKWHFGGKIHE